VRAEDGQFMSILTVEIMGVFDYFNGFPYDMGMVNANVW
jgi:hypothetical protein